MTTIASYGWTNFTGVTALYNEASPFGQTFYTNEAYKLDSCRFYIYCGDGVTGNVCVKIYEVAGYDSVPTAGAIATSDSLVFNALQGFTTFWFTGSNQILLNANSYYLIAVDTSGTNSSYASPYLYIGVDNTSPTHEGTLIYSDWGTWYNGATYDVIFDVYGHSKK